MKLALTGETYKETARGRIIDGVIAAFATIYSIWVIIASTADIKTFMLGVILLLSGIFFYPQVKKAAQQSEETQKMSA